MNYGTKSREHPNRVLVQSTLSVSRNQIESNGNIMYQLRMFNRYGLNEIKKVKCKPMSHHVCFLINLLKPTGYVIHHQFNIQQLYALLTLFMCFVFTWEQTATCATYIINWLVFITELKSVYSAVRTGALNTASLRFVCKRLKCILCQKLILSISVVWSGDNLAGSLKRTEVLTPCPNRTH
jgi:hypothetical protein